MYTICARAIVKRVPYMAHHLSHHF